MLEEQGIPQISACQTWSQGALYFRIALLLRHMILTAGIYQVSEK
jgi:hypothetical protein